MSDPVGEREQAENTEIESLRRDLALAQRDAEVCRQRTFELSSLYADLRRQANEPAHLLAEVVAYALGDTSKAWSLPVDNIWRRAIEAAAQFDEARR